MSAAELSELTALIKKLFVAHEKKALAIHERTARLVDTLMHDAREMRLEHARDVAKQERVAADISARVDVLELELTELQ